MTNYTAIYSTAHHFGIEYSFKAENIELAKVFCADKFEAINIDLRNDDTGEITQIKNGKPIKLTYAQIEDIRLNRHDINVIPPAIAQKVSDLIEAAEMSLMGQVGKTPQYFNQTDWKKVYKIVKNHLKNTRK